MRLIDLKNGYDAKLMSEYQSVTIEYDGHIFDISKDKYGLHVMVDSQPCKSYPDELSVILVRYINTNKLL